MPRRVPIEEVRRLLRKGVQLSKERVERLRGQDNPLLQRDRNCAQAEADALAAALAALEGDAVNLRIYAGE